MCGCQTAREKRRIRSILNTGGNGSTGGNCSTVKHEYKKKNHCGEMDALPVWYRYVVGRWVPCLCTVCVCHFYSTYGYSSYSRTENTS